MKKIKVIGRVNIINKRTGYRHDDEGLHVLNGIFESETKEIQESEENKCEIADKLIEKLKDLHPQLKGGGFEIVDVD